MEKIIIPSDHQRPVAVGILAHAFPDLLNQLVAGLLPHFDVYLHVDKASKLDVRQFEWTDQVTLLKRRKTYWGSFNCTRAVLDFLATAKPRNYSRYVFISGQDLPLKTDQEILQFFSKNNDLDFIESFALPSPALHGGLERITRAYWHAPYRHRGARRFFYNVIEYFLEAGYRTLLQPKVLSGKYFWGEAGFALRGETVNKIFEYLEENPGYAKIFKGSRLGEEIFLQTLVKRINPPAKLAGYTTTYADWKTGPEKPRVLTADDLPKLKDTQHLFARKVHPEKSKELIAHFRTES